MTKEIDLSELLHENTKTRPGLQSRWGTPPPPTLALTLTDASIRTYASAPSVALPRPVERAETDLADAIRGRRSVRAFGEEPFPLHALAQVLHFANGVRGVDQIHGFRDWRRNLPSAGNLGSVDLYPLVLRVNGIASGVYHYHPVHHRLFRIGERPSRRVLEEALLQPTLAAAGALVVLASALSRVRTKYGERGYRYACIDAGHAAQNLCLAATALGLAACPVGSFCDDQLNGLLGLDGQGDAALYLVALGMERQ